MITTGIVWAREATHRPGPTAAALLRPVGNSPGGGDWTGFVNCDALDVKMPPVGSPTGGGAVLVPPGGPTVAVGPFVTEGEGTSVPPPCESELELEGMPPP